MSPEVAKQMAFAFSEAIAPAGRPMPLVPMFEKRGYLEEWSAWQTQPQTAAEREAIRAGRRVTPSKSGKVAPGDRQRPAKLWGGMMQREPTVVVVDLDDVQKMRDWVPATLDRYTREVPTPVQVTTGRDGGGRHLYYRVEGEAPALETRTTRVGYDLKGAAGLVVLPGSLHATGRLYELLIDGAAADPRRFKPGELHARLPAFPLAGHLADLERLNLRGGIARRRPTRQTDDDRFIKDEAHALVVARRVCHWHLRERGPAVSGEGGHTKTMSLLHYLGDLGVPEHVAYVAATDWNAKNLPPWSDRELQEKLRDAFWGAHRRDPLGCRMDDAALIVDALGA